MPILQVVSGLHGHVGVHASRGPRLTGRAKANPKQLRRSGMYHMPLAAPPFWGWGAVCACICMWSTHGYGVLVGWGHGAYVRCASDVVRPAAVTRRGRTPAGFCFECAGHHVAVPCSCLGVQPCSHGACLSISCTSLPPSPTCTCTASGLQHQPAPATCSQALHADLPSALWSLLRPRAGMHEKRTSLPPCVCDRPDNT